MQAQQPHFMGYGLLVGEVCRVLLACVFILRSGLAFPGVVLSIIIAFAVKIVFCLRSVILEKSKNPFGDGYASERILTALKSRLT